MFEQSFVRPQSRARTGWTVLVSTSIQIVMLGAAILFPLLSPDLLPRLIADSILVAPPGPPPGRAPLPERTAQPRALARRAAPDGFYQPVAVPDRVAAVIDEPAETGGSPGDGGVVGGLPVTGDPSPLLSGIIQAANTKAPPANPAPGPVRREPEGPRRVVSTSQLEQGMLIDRVQPVYPPLAIHMRIQGTVVLRTIVGTDGRIKELAVVTGHPILVQAAVNAVRQWRYRPTVLNGEAVEVVAPVEVHFRLGQ